VTITNRISTKCFAARTILISILILIAASLLSACTSIDKKMDYKAAGFVGGDEGLRTRLVTGAPPQVIQAGGLMPFSFLLMLDNVGEARIGPGTDNPLILVRLLGVIHKDFGLTTDSAALRLSQVLEPARRNIDGSVTPGEATSVEFNDLSYKPGVLGTLALTLRAEVCYDYESLATAKFCMKSDLLESSQDSTICSLRGPRIVGNSGAPLHVSFVEQAPTGPYSIQVNFKVEHFGNGAFFARSSPVDNYKPCEFNDYNPDLYKVEVIVEPVQKGTYDVSCLRLDERISGGGAKGVVRMSRAAPLSLTCFVKRNSPSESRLYEDILNIRLRYRYGEFIEVPLLIQGQQ
jgi:hypothetical protein